MACFCIFQVLLFELSFFFDRSFPLRQVLFVVRAEMSALAKVQKFRFCIFVSVCNLHTVCYTWKLPQNHRFLQIKMFSIYENWECLNLMVSH